VALGSFQQVMGSAPTVTGPCLDITAINPVKTREYGVNMAALAFRLYIFTGTSLSRPTSITMAAWGGVRFRFVDAFGGGSGRAEEIGALWMRGRRWDAVSSPGGCGTILRHLCARGVLPCACCQDRLPNADCQRRNQTTWKSTF